jgi:hypothetical protein
VTKGSDMSAAARPTDEELMLFVDGELEGARLEEVEAFAERDVSARRKVAALRLSGSLLRERALAPSIADGIADTVMAKIVSSNGAGKVIPIRSLADGTTAAPKPSNDNARRIFAIAAVAVAAAAAFLVWQKSNSPVVSPQAPVAALRLPPPALTMAKTADAVPQPAKPESEGRSVEVASVDFGAKSGSIFYVPSDVAPSMKTTAVVWINDDSAAIP